ncbi:DUF4834 family protein [Parapedobacter sp. 10938]|uniref:DUF4834 family protein n=1 Tax=Parapedobacter flavus TaxID=3110225 RepID=UPI002DBE1551|nr:DUF4834 family protein [Parapedobacter sp. 10938]MEC3881409.1 DUF4834 family protein [Parapedobacter sp. 10938]
MGLLKFLVIAIAVLWLVRLVARLLFPWAMRKMAEKVMGNAQQQYQQGNTTFRGANPSGRRQPDGKVRIEYMPPQDKPKNGAKNAGEFVDFEEIKSSAE